MLIKAVVQPTNSIVNVKDARLLKLRLLMKLLSKIKLPLMFLHVKGCCGIGDDSMSSCVVASLVAIQTLNCILVPS